MTFISYAQNGEDVVLSRALSHVETGFYVDVGAADPEEHSVTNAFYERGWSGINIEPLQEHFDRLSNARPRDLNLKVAAAREAGLCTLHAIGGTGLSTSDAQVAERHVEAGFRAVPVIVPALTLTNILSGCASKIIHFLKIDVEGAEEAVLAGMNFEIHRPWIVLVESTAPLSPEDKSASWEPLLLGSRYEFVFFDGLNRFYVAEEHRELAARLAKPPNVFDDFIPVALHRAIGRADTLQAETSRLGELLHAAERDRATLQSEREAAARHHESLSAQLTLDLEAALAKQQELSEKVRAAEDKARIVLVATDALQARLESAENARRSAEATQRDAEAARMRADEASEATQAREALAAAAAAASRLEAESALQRLRVENQEKAHAMLARDALLGSTAWQVTWPARWLAETLPAPVKWHGRRALKAGWWAATPWRTPGRLRTIRRRTMQSSETTTVDEPVPDAAHQENHVEPLAPPDERAEPPLAVAVSTSYERWISAYEEPVRATSGHAPMPIEHKQIDLSFLIVPGNGDQGADATIRSIMLQQGLTWEALVAQPAAGTAFMSAPAEASLEPVIKVAIAPGADKGTALHALLERAAGSRVAVLDAGDVLHPDAGARLSHAISKAPDAAIIYSDEDVLDRDDKRDHPLFKPRWSPQLLESFNYFGRLTVIARQLALLNGGFVEGMGAGAEWDLNLRVANDAEGRGLGIERIAHVLCHRRFGSDRDRPRPNSLAASQQRKALRAFWARSGLQATIATQPDGTQRSSWNLLNPPLVSVIIPNRNSHALLERCLDGLLEHTNYPRLEIIIVENRSDDEKTWRLYDRVCQRPNVRVVRLDRAFNYSAACNHGASLANGAILLFLNNDIEVVEEGWLAELVRVVTRPGVGIAGTKLLYPDGTLQHAGVAVGIHLYGLMYHRADEHEWGVFGSPNHTRNWSAIMGACQMIRREVFDAVGGFNEAYQIANSDVALCLRAQRLGWRTAYTPFGALIHHEGMSRGRTNPARDMSQSVRELQRLGLLEDPYLHPQLSGLDGKPRLREPAEASLRETLQIVARGFVDAAEPRDQPLDLYDNLEVQNASGLAPETFLWMPQPSHLIQDVWSAARWVLDLVRYRPDLRRRFPHALTDGAGGSFCSWLCGGGRLELGLSDAACEQIARLFGTDLSARPRQLYFWREDVHTAFPLGLLPAGRRRLASWMLQHRHETSLRLEEIWWFLLACAEDPARELVRTYLFTPAWQEAHPYGLTIFGRGRFAAWLTEYYDIPEDAGWLLPKAWRSGLSRVEQIKLAYAARDDWRHAHPDAWDNQDSASGLLSWLARGGSNLDTEARAWCEECLTDATRDALAAPGVNIVGHFCYPSGLRASAEAIANAVEENGGLVSRRDVRTDPGDDPHHSEIGGLEPFDITIIHTQPEPFFDSAFARSDLLERKPRTYRIAYWYWELDAVPESWAQTAQAVDEIWAATNFVADALRQVSPVPVYTLFPGVRIGSYTKRPREYFGLRSSDQDRFVFLFSFHMASVMARKNPKGLIEAFRQAFSSDEPVDLVIKTTSFGRYDSQVAELVEAARGANITIIDRVTTPDETLSLMECCDAYVSLHRSEGLGLTMAEAMLLGKPVIATRYSGNLDFMDDANSLLVDYQLVPLGPGVPPYDPAALWAEPSVDHAAHLMRKLYENREWARALGERARSDAIDRLSLVAAGKRLIARLARIKADGPAMHRKTGHAYVELDGLPV